MRGFNNVERTGALILSSRAKEIRNRCMTLVSELNKLGVESNFDIHHDNGGNIGVSEWVSQINGFCLRYMNVEVQSKILEYAYHHSNDDTRCVTQFITKSDKYQLSVLPDFLRYDNIIFLCGSNLLFTLIEPNQLHAIIDNYPNVKIKPHPLTNIKDINLLKNTFGDDVILARKLPGIELFNRAKHVWVPHTSEMSLNAVIQNKHYTVIGNEHSRRGLYFVINNVIKKLHTATGESKLRILNKIVFSPYSGIYLSQSDFVKNHKKFLEQIITQGGFLNDNT